MESQANMREREHDLEGFKVGYPLSAPVHARKVKGLRLCGLGEAEGAVLSYLFSMRHGSAVGRSLHRIRYGCRPY